MQLLNNFFWIRHIKLIFSNEELDGIIKIVKSLQKSGLLMKSVRETVENEVNEKKGGFNNILKIEISTLVQETTITTATNYNNTNQK